jgi:hypothetical protein
MATGFTPLLLRLKLLHACDQWHSSRAFTLLPVGTVNSAQALKGGWWRTARLLTMNSATTLTTPHTTEGRLVEDGSSAEILRLIEAGAKRPAPNAAGLALATGSAGRGGGHEAMVAAVSARIEADKAILGNTVRASTLVAAHAKQWQEVQQEVGRSLHAERGLVGTLFPMAPSLANGLARSSLFPPYQRGGVWCSSLPSSEVVYGAPPSLAARWCMVLFPP